MANWLTGLFQKNNLNRPKTDGPPARSSKLKMTRRTMGYDTAVKSANALDHPVIYRCVNKIATSVGFVDWYVERIDDYKGAHVSDEQIQYLNNLLQDPNDGMTAQQLRYWMALNMALNARVPYLITQSSMRNLQGIYPLDGQYLSKELSSTGIAESYIYETGTFKKVYKTGVAVRRAQSAEPYVEELYLPNLSGFNYKGVDASALRAMGLPASVITYLMQRCVDTASGRPNVDYIVSTERTLTHEQEIALRERLDEAKAGGEVSGDILILHNTKIQVTELKNDMSDIHTKVPVDDMTRMIAGLFGIPVALMGLGAADGSKFAGNYVESRLTFWEDTIVPGYLTPMAHSLTRAICPPGARLRFDLDSIPALQAGRASLAKELSGVQFLTKNEKRELLGFKSRDDGDAYDITNPGPQQPKSGSKDEKSS